MTALALIRLRRWALPACLFAIVLGLNWAVAERYGSDMPDWDQWDAEGLNLIAPWFEHDHFITHLFQPHNEHRVVITKLQNLAVLLVAGQWDERLECFFNAFLHAGIAVGLWLLARRWLRPGWSAASYVLVGALFALPFAWQNLLGGFHSQQYWLIGLSFLAIVMVPYAATWSARWWIGVVAGILAFGTMGSGFFAIAVVAAVVAWRWLRREITLRDALPVFVVAAVLIALGFATRVEVYYHEQLKAKTLHDFIFSVVRSLAWPCRDHDWIAAILWLPFGLIGWQFARAPRNAPPIVTTILALDGWVLIQLLATAYARGAGAGYPASRYMDTLIFATAVNGVALGWLLSTAIRRSTKTFLYVVGIGWVGLLAVGGNFLLRINLDHELPDTAVYYRSAEGHLRSYLATKDSHELQEPIPYPSAEALLVRLTHPSLREYMPESVRPALPLVPAAGDNGAGFIENQVPVSMLPHGSRGGLAPGTPPLDSRKTWGSFNRAGVANSAEWRSAPLVSPMHGWLRFETAGDLGTGDVSLELHDAATDKRLATIVPTKIPHETWRSVYVPAPTRPFVVVAKDNDATRWMAFSAPVEMNSLSYLTWQAMKNGVALACVAAALAAFLGASAALTRKSL